MPYLSCTYFLDADPLALLRAAASDASLVHLQRAKKRRSGATCFPRCQVQADHSINPFCVKVFPDDTYARSGSFAMMMMCLSLALVELCTPFADTASRLIYGTQCN